MTSDVVRPTDRQNLVTDRLYMNFRSSYIPVLLRSLSTKISQPFLVKCTNAQQSGSYWPCLIYEFMMETRYRTYAPQPSPPTIYYTISQGLEKHFKNACHPAIGKKGGSRTNFTQVNKIWAQD